MDSRMLSLLKGIKAQEPGALDEFFRLVEKRVLAFGLKFCGNADDARDIAQQTLLQAYRSLPTLDFDDLPPLRVWLYRVARNYCFMMRRKQQRPVERTIPLEVITEQAETITQRLQIADRSDIPEERLRRKEVAEMVREATIALPPDYRMVLILRDLEELSTREVAEILEISEDNVKIRLHRARRQVRETLGRRLGTTTIKNGGVEAGLGDCDQLGPQMSR